MERLVALKRLNAVLALLPPAAASDEATRRRLAETLVCLVRLPDGGCSWRSSL